jgi:hypothetical protein
MHQGKVWSLFPDIPAMKNHTKLGAKSGWTFRTDIPHTGSVVVPSSGLTNDLPGSGGIHSHLQEFTRLEILNPTIMIERTFKYSQPVASHKRKFLCRRALATHAPTSRRSRLCSSRLLVPYGNPEHPEKTRTPSIHAKNEGVSNYRLGHYEGRPRSSQFRLWLVLTL